MVSSTYAPDDAIQEMIRITVQRLSAKQRQPNIAKKKILKVLFKVKQQLPYGNYIKGRLAYYWYKDGPYSEIVDAGISQLVLDGNLKKTTVRGTTYELDAQKGLAPMITYDDDMNEARNVIGRMTESFVNIHDTIQDIYDEAPYEWYGVYNYTFRNKFETYCDSIINGHASSVDNNDIQDALDDAVLKYPPLPEFIEHRQIFMDFAKMLNAFLQSDIRANKDHLDTLQQLSADIWDVFAHGVRVKNHDDYYSGRVESWLEMYKQKIYDLNAEILEKIPPFEAAIPDNMRFSPEIEDMVLHPEKYDFTPLQVDAVAELDS